MGTFDYFSGESHLGQDTLSAAQCPGTWHRCETFLLLAALVSGLAGCKVKETPADAWYVVNLRDSRWTIVHTDHANRQQVRYVLTCNWSKWRNHESIQGGCDLPVGKTLVWNGLPDKPSNFVDVWISGDDLFITEGEGASFVSQGFTIQSATLEVLDPKLPPATRPRTLQDTWKK